MPKKRFKYENTADNTSLEVTCNKHEPSDHSLYINVQDKGFISSSHFASAFMAIEGESAIRNVIYEMALAGGLISEGESLHLRRPKMIPEDGVYRLEGASEQRRIAVVKKGRVFIPQVPETNELKDFTNVYLRDYCDWSLIPLIEKGANED